MQNNKVFITGIGVVCPLGNDVVEFRKNLLAGRSSVKPIAANTGAIGLARVAGIVREPDLRAIFKPAEKNHISGLNPTTRRVVFATRCALKSTQLDQTQILRMRFFSAFGTNVGHLPAAGPQPVRLEDFRNHKLISSICRIENIDCPGVTLFSNCSAGMNAVGYGYQKIRSGRSDMAIVGGYETFRPMIFEKLAKLGLLAKERCRPFDAMRNGMYAGEGVGVLILEKAQQAVAAGRRVFGEILGFGMGFDAYHPTKFSPVGRGIHTAMSTALRTAKIPPDKLDCIFADAKGLKDGDHAEAHAIYKLFRQDNEKVPVSSMKSQLTHSLGASGPLNLIAGLLCLEENVVLPIQNHCRKDAKIHLNLTVDRPLRRPLNTIMVNAIGLGGNSGSMIIKKVVPHD